MRGTSERVVYAPIVGKTVYLSPSTEEPIAGAREVRPTRCPEVEGLGSRRATKVQDISNYNFQ